jgi:hypothetical protein
MEIIYCAGGNKRFHDIASAEGWRYGARLPDTVYGPLYFADQEWKQPDRAKYVAHLAAHQPFMATVLDWEHEEQFPEILAWAEEAAQHARIVVIIPKVIGGIGRIPAMIGGRPVHLGYSIPTKFGGTAVPIWEFGRRPIHLLGGSPQAQMTLFRYLNVQSLDGNMMQLMAIRHCAFWTPDRTRFRRGYWPTLEEADGRKWETDAPYEAFRRSCVHIMQAWRLLDARIGE